LIVAWPGRRQQLVEDHVDLDQREIAQPSSTTTDAGDADRP
jgi:hypothetical protein